MARLGFRWADRDIRRTKDGRYVVIHWLKDFKVPASFPHQVEQMTLAQVLSLHSKTGGWRVHTLEQDFRALHAARMNAYIEPKHWATIPDQAHADYIARMGKKYGVKLRGYTLRANRRNLPFMNRAGIPSHCLRK